MDLQILDDGKGVKFTAEPVNKAGKQVSLPEGVIPTWLSSNPDVLSIAPDPTDPTGITAIGTPVSDGTSVVASITADIPNPDGNGFTTIHDDGTQAPIDVVADTVAGGFLIQEAAQ